MFKMLIANIVGLTLFFFLFWKRLKDDYHYEKIFNLGFIVVIGLVVGLLFSRLFFQSYWHWISTISVFVFYFIYITRQKIKFFESFEVLVISFLPWISLVFLSDAINKSSLSSFLLFWVTLIAIFLYFLINSQYRKFTWYKSGRVGLAGLVTGLFYFFSRIVLSLIYPQSISLVPKFEIYYSSAFALVFFLLTYKLFTSNE